MKPLTVKIILSLFLLAAAGVHAQESVEMNPVVVRDEKEDASTTVINEQELEQKQPTDLEDVLRDHTDVVVGGGSRTAQKVYVRGIEDTQLNVTIDGARQTGKLFHHQGRLIVDPELLKQVEVEAGTGDALAGPGALGGALRFQTKDIEELLLPGSSLGALTKFRYHTNNDEKGLSFALYGKPTEKLGLMGYVNMAESINYEAGGGGRVSYTGGRPKGALVKAAWRPTANQKLTFSSTLRNDNAWRSSKANMGSGTGTDQKLESLSHTLGYDLIGATPWVNLHAEAYSSDSKMTNNSGSGDRTGQITSVGGEVRNEFRFSRMTVTAGVDAHQDRARSQGTTGQNAEMGDIYGIFAQGSYDLTSSWRWGAGVRFDDYHLKDVAGNKHQDQHFSPNVKTRYFFNDQVSGFASWSQAFQGPTPLEAYIMQSADGVAPSEDVKGTLAETVEAGFQGKHTAFGWSLVAYETRMRHPLQSGLNRTTHLVERINTDDIVTRGVTVGIENRFGLLNSHLSFTHNKTKYGKVAGGYSVANRAVSFGDRLVASLDYPLFDRSLILNWDSLIAFRMNDVPQGQAQPPSYDVHDLSLIWNRSEQLRLGVSCQNIFDRKYIAHGTVYLVGGEESPLYEPGRDFRIWASYLF